MLVAVQNAATSYKIDVSLLMNVLKEDPAAKKSVEPAKQLSESVQPPAKKHRAEPHTSIRSLAQQLYDRIQAAVERCKNMGRYVFSEIVFVGRWFHKWFEDKG